MLVRLKSQAHTARPMAWTIVVIVATCLTPREAPAKLSGATSPTVKFAAVGTAGMHIEGSTSELLISEDPDSVVITVALAKLETGIGLRDGHMKDKYLEVGKYPTAEFRVARHSLVLPEPAGQTEGEATGTLTLHGTTKPASVHYKVKRSSDYAVTSTLHINMNDYGIVVPAYLGIKVKPEVDIDVQFHAIDR